MQIELLSLGSLTLLLPPNCNKTNVLVAQWSICCEQLLSDLFFTAAWMKQGRKPKWGETFFAPRDYFMVDQLDSGKIIKGFSLTEWVRGETLTWLF